MAVEASVLLQVPHRTRLHRARKNQKKAVGTSTFGWTYCLDQWQIKLSLEFPMEGRRQWGRWWSGKAHMIEFRPLSERYAILSPCLTPWVFKVAVMLIQSDRSSENVSESPVSGQIRNFLSGHSSAKLSIKSRIVDTCSESSVWLIAQTEYNKYIYLILCPIRLV